MNGDSTYDVVVIGAGAAGLFAATESASLGSRTLLLEKNRRAGVKILASGGTRCNVTSTLPVKELGRLFGKKADRFLRHGLHTFTPQHVRELLDHEGVATSEHPMEKIFPDSGRADDVLQAFLRRLHRSGAELATSEPVENIDLHEGSFNISTPGRVIRCQRVIVTSGGRSYPKTGTTGDGYHWLERLGHKIVDTRPALVPLLIDKPWIRQLTGIAVPDAVVSAVDQEGRTIFERRRPVLFTHRGFSGPGPMDVSGYLNTGDSGSLHVRVDWLPSMKAEEIQKALQSGHQDDMAVADSVKSDLPRRLMEALLRETGIPTGHRTSQLTRGERHRVVEMLKRCVIEVSGDEGFDKAEVTAGGIPLEEVDPKTMESRIVPGLFVAGEILDYDGPIGGFNFQAAFSTGILAGRAAAQD